jgi:hypothetical protein
VSFAKIAKLNDELYSLYGNGIEDLTVHPEVFYYLLNDISQIRNLSGIQPKDVTVNEGVEIVFHTNRNSIKIKKNVNKIIEQKLELIKTVQEEIEKLRSL